MKVRTTKELDGEHGPIPIGTEFDREDCGWLIRLDCAEPLDDEAQAVADEHAAKRKRLQDRLFAQAMEAQEQQQREQAAEEKQRHAEFEQQLLEGV